MQNKPIKYILFDLGGVVIQDFSGTNKWNEMLSDLGLDASKMKDFEQIFQKYVGNLCKGILGPRELIRKMEEEADIQFPRNYDLIQDFVMRFEENKNLGILLKELKKNYKIGLLTNMYPGMLGLIEEKGILPDIDWDIIIDSSIIGMKKPDKNIYLYAERETGVQGASILFIDNLEENIISAKNLGWNTLLYNATDVPNSNKAILNFLQDCN